MPGAAWSRTISLLTASLLLSIIALPAQAQIRLDLPAQPLGTSLTAVGTLGHLNVMFDPSVVDGLRAPALKAELSADDALARLLSGTKLHTIRVDANTIRVVAEPTLKPAQSTSASPTGGLYTAGSIHIAYAGSDAAPTVGQQPNGSSFSEGAKEGAEEPAPSTPLALEEVVVTGTHIAGAAPVGSQVLLITADDIERSGYATIGDVIRSLPQSFGGGANPGVVGATGSQNLSVSSAATVNLRGIGSDSTLALVDGHRLASDGSGSAFDISTIPLAAIDRVEILTDSASAIYGSDAIAGVANLLLKKNFNGAETVARYGLADGGGASQREVSQIFGGSWTSGNAFLTYEHFGQNELPAFHRSFAAEAGPQTLLPAQNKNAVLVSTNQELSSGASIYLEALYSDRTDKTVIFYGPVSNPPYGNTTYPGAVRVRLYSLSAGLSAKLGQRWAASLDGTFSRSRDDETSSSVTDGIAISNPDYIYGNKTASIEANTAGAAVDLPGGPLKVALGTGYRSEGYYDEQGTPSKQRHINYAYAELRIPVIPANSLGTWRNQLDLSVSGRYEHYSDFGSSSSPKIGIRYVPTSGLAIRGSWGKAYKAPNLVAEYGQRDFYIAPASAFGVDSPPDAQAVYTYGANLALRPQRANSWTAGFDLSPSQLFPVRLSATYYNIRYTNLITQPVSSLGAALLNPIYAPFVTRNPSVYVLQSLAAASNYIQDYTGGAYLPQKVVALIYDQNQNVASENVHGVDLITDYRLQTSLGDVDLSLNATWASLTQVLVPGTSAIVLGGTVFNPTKFRARVGSTFQTAMWSVSGFLNYTGSEIDNTDPTAPKEVASLATSDLQLTYSAANWGGLLRGLRVSVAVQNVFDRKPPYLSGSATYIPDLHYDSTNASPLGRFVSLALQEKW